MTAIVVTMSMDQWASYMKKLKDSFMPAAIRGIQAGAMQCVPLMQNRTEAAPKASPRGTTGAFNYGHYKAAWTATPMDHGARVSNKRPYSSVIDYGRRMSPVSKTGVKQIEAWARNKLGVPANEARAAAYAIAASLAGRGDKRHPLLPRRVMSGAIEQMTEIVRWAIDEFLSQALRGRG